MGFRINTNVPALQSQTALGKTVRETQDSSAKLASGQRIVKAADDAAGLAISEKIKAHIRSSKQADRNANDGISMVQVAEGGLNESTSILTRMRELAIQAASDTMNDGDRANSSYEYEALKQELDRIAKGIEYNGRKLLDGSGPRLDFHVGVGSVTQDDTISFDASKYRADTHTLGVAPSTILSKHGAQQSLEQLDGAFNTIAGHRSMLGSVQNRLMTSSNNLGIYHQNMNAANSRIRDLDYADEAANLARNQVVLQAGTAVAAQANVSGKAALKLVE